jgi:hypothetical protein
MTHHHIFEECTVDHLTLPSDIIPLDHMAHVVYEIAKRIPMETFLPYYKRRPHLRKVGRDALPLLMVP